MSRRSQVWINASSSSGAAAIRRAFAFSTLLSPIVWAIKASVCRVSGNEWCGPVTNQAQSVPVAGSIVHGPGVCFVVIVARVRG